MAYREFPPHARLAGLVQKYWQMAEQHGGAETEHRFLPEHSVRLTFSAGTSYQGALTGGGLEPLPAAALYGLTLDPVRVVSPGLTRALGVELYPWGARQLFGWQFGAGDAHGTLDVGGQYPVLSRTVCALLRLDAWEEARQTVEAWLLGLLVQREQAPGAGVRAAGQLYGSGGTLRVGALAEGLNLSARQLERRFVQEVGVGAKTLARLIRFQAAQQALAAGSPLAALAHDLGFSDQAHLSREFRALSHMTPQSFARFAQARLGARGRDHDGFRAESGDVRLTTVETRFLAP